MAAQGQVAHQTVVESVLEAAPAAADQAEVALGEAGHPEGELGPDPKVAQVQGPEAGQILDQRPRRRRQEVSC